MILKIGGIIAIFAVCVAAGLLKSASLSKRVRELEAFLSALTLISNEIRYFASPTDDIIEKLDDSNEYKQLIVFSLCKSKLEKTRNLSLAWVESIELSKSRLSLDEGDLETLKWFGNVFGTTDAQGQMANCERYSGLLQNRLESAKEDKRKRGRMYTSLGVLAGVFLVVIFL